MNVKQHKQGVYAGYTNSSREKQLKAGNGAKKIKLMEFGNLSWKDLYGLLI